MNKDYYERLARAYFRGRAVRTGQADAGVQDPKLYYFKRGHEELPRVRKTLGFLRSVIFESADTAVWDNSFEGCTGLEEESMRRIPEHFRRPLELWINSSGSGFALRLHNRQERHFVFDDVVCGSLEGVLQSLKFPDSAVQEEICGLSGREAYEAGMDPGWKETQTLYWRGEAYARESAEYDCLMDRLYQAVYDQDPQFRLDVNLLKGAKLYLKKGSSRRANHVQTRAELFWELLRFANPEMSREDAKRMAEAGRKSRQKNSEKTVGRIQKWRCPGILPELKQRRTARASWYWEARSIRPRQRIWRF